MKNRNVDSRVHELISNVYINNYGEKPADSVIIDRLLDAFVGPKVGGIGATSTCKQCGFRYCVNCGQCFKGEKEASIFTYDVYTNHCFKRMQSGVHNVNLVFSLNNETEDRHSRMVTCAKEILTQRRNRDGKTSCACNLRRCFWAPYVDFSKIGESYSHDYLNGLIHPTVTLDVIYDDPVSNYMDVIITLDNSCWNVKIYATINSSSNAERTRYFKVGRYRYDMVPSLETQKGELFCCLNRLDDNSQASGVEKKLLFPAVASLDTISLFEGMPSSIRRYRVCNGYSNDVNKLMIRVIDLFISWLYRVKTVRWTGTKISFHYTVTAKYNSDLFTVTANPRIYMPRLGLQMGRSGKTYLL